MTYRVVTEAEINGDPNEEDFKWPPMKHELVHKKKPKFTKVSVNHELIAYMYKKNENIAAIALELGHTAKTVSTSLDKSGVKKRRRGIAK